MSLYLMKNKDNSDFHVKSCFYLVSDMTMVTLVTPESMATVVKHVSVMVTYYTS